MDTERLLMKVVDELDKFADKGITSSNIESIYKLVDIYKDLKKVEMMEVAGPYSQYSGGNNVRDTYSGQRRDGRGRYTHGNDTGYSYGYSGDYDRYMDTKSEYRRSKSPECKQRLMDTVDQCMASFTSQMQDLLRDSECQEERQTIQRYLRQLQNLQ